MNIEKKPSAAEWMPALDPSQIAVVLVNTSHPGNIGATARAMKNMGLTQLILVDPEDFPSGAATARAVSAVDILENARVVSTLEEAVADCGLIIGTSARSRKLPWPMLDGESCADKVFLEPQKTTIDLSAIQIKEVDFSKLNSNNLYEFELPISKKIVKIKLLTHKDELAINADIQAMNRLSKGKDSVSQDVSTRLRYMIQEVDGNSERGFINKWVQNNLLARDSRAIRNFVKEISPDLDLKYEFTSEITGETEALDIPFGIGFFYPTE